MASFRDDLLGTTTINDDDQDGDDGQDDGRGEAAAGKRRRKLRPSAVLALGKQAQEAFSAALLRAGWEKAPPDGDDQDADDDDDVRAYRTEWGDLRITEEIWRCDFDEAALSKSSSSSSSSKAKAKTSGAHHEMLLEGTALLAVPALQPRAVRSGGPAARGASLRGLTGRLAGAAGRGARGTPSSAPVGVFKCALMFEVGSAVRLHLKTTNPTAHPCCFDFEDGDHDDDDDDAAKVGRRRHLAGQFAFELAAQKVSFPLRRPSGTSR